VKFVLAYNPEIASLVRRRREKALEKANDFIQEIRTRLKNARDGTSRGRPLTPEGALVQVRDYLKKHNLLRYFQLELNGRRGFGQRRTPGRATWKSS